jgi:hypothetical protein
MRRAIKALTVVFSALASDSRRFHVSAGRRTLRTAVGLLGGRPRRTSRPSALDGISHRDQSAMPSAGSKSANGWPGTRFQTFRSKGSSTQFVDFSLRWARFTGADDTDGVPADLRVDDEEEALVLRERDEDEAVFIPRRLVAKVAAVRILKASRGFIEGDPVFSSIRRCLLRIPFEGERQAIIVTQQFRRFKRYDPGMPHEGMNSGLCAAPRGTKPALALLLTSNRP